MQKPAKKASSKVEKPPAKKQKKTAAAAAVDSDSEEENSNNGMLMLAKNRFVNVSEFKGKVYVNIREYYENADGKQMPGECF